MIKKITISAYDEKPITLEVAVLPCPHCGGIDLNLASYQGPDSWQRYARIECKPCDSRGPETFHTAAYNVHPEFKVSWKTAQEQAEKKAIDAWNRRAKP